MPLAWGVAESDRIVVGRVTSLRSESGVRLASLHVEKTLKGPATSIITFVAEPTWSCDISSATIGERVLLLVRRVGDFDRKWSPNLVGLAGRSQPVYMLTHAGRGRLTLSERGHFVGPPGREWEANFIFPKELHSARSPYIREKALLSYVERVIRKPLSEKELEAEVSRGN